MKIGHANRMAVGDVQLFDPADGVTVIEPPGARKGFWAGGCSALFDETSGRFYLCYRERTPERRGFVSRVATSKDGQDFETVWSGTSDSFQSPSIEKSSIFLTDDGIWRLYVSYVDGRTNRWRIDLLEAESPEAFRVEDRVPVLTPEICGNEGVKDPVIYSSGGITHMFANYAPSPPDADPRKVEQMHAEGNAFVSGVVNTGTGLATSVSGTRFEWHGSVLKPGEGWDAFMVRAASVLYTPPVFTLFYDGRPDVAESYEDKCGIAVSYDLRSFCKVSLDAPVLQVLEGTGCLRYLSAVPVGDRTFYYYECARRDGSHELRLSVVKR